MYSLCLRFRTEQTPVEPCVEFRQCRVGVQRPVDGQRDALGVILGVDDVAFVFLQPCPSGLLVGEGQLQARATLRLGQQATGEAGADSSTAGSAAVELFTPSGLGLRPMAFEEKLSRINEGVAKAVAKAQTVH